MDNLTYGQQCDQDLDSHICNHQTNYSIFTQLWKVSILQIFRKYLNLKIMCYMYREEGRYNMQLSCIWRSLIILSLDLSQSTRANALCTLDYMSANQNYPVPSVSEIFTVRSTDTGVQQHVIFSTSAVIIRELIIMFSLSCPL